MILADIKKSSISKRKLFEIERAVEREIIDLWCKEKSYFNENFAGAVDVEFKGKRMDISFTPALAMKYGSPEATVNDMMRGLILTMATEPGSGRLLKNHEVIIGNILDVYPNFWIKIFLSLTSFHPGILGKKCTRPLSTSIGPGRPKPTPNISLLLK